MSFDSYKKTIEEGDTVILFLGYDNMLQFTVEKSKTHQTRYGALKHKDLIGVSFGSKIQCSKGYAHVLHPTPELWTQTLPHRTQILYSTDISFITLLLDLKPGCVVVESGTGSGSLSHAILRTITPGGYLHTFDFHEQRVAKAQVEFKDHGFGENVTVKHKDVLAEGFDLEHVADAVFLDLPAPWDAVPHAKKALKKTGGRLCSFSPCIEQVQKACEALREVGFSEIQTFECLSRTFDVKTINMPVANLGYPLTSDMNAKGVGLLVDRGDSIHHPVIGQIEIGDDRDQGRRKRHKGQQNQSHTDRSTKSEVQSSDKMDDDSALTKEQSGSETVDKSKEGISAAGEGDSEKKIPASEPAAKRINPDRNIASYVFKSGLTPTQMPGHTGYLTYATLFP